MVGSWVAYSVCVSAAKSGVQMAVRWVALLADNWAGLLD